MFYQYIGSIHARRLFRIWIYAFARYPSPEISFQMDSVLWKVSPVNDAPYSAHRSACRGRLRNVEFAHRKPRFYSFF